MDRETAMKIKDAAGDLIDAKVKLRAVMRRMEDALSALSAVKDEDKYSELADDKDTVYHAMNATARAERELTAMLPSMSEIVENSNNQEMEVRS